MHQAAAAIGEPVPNEADIFRAFSDKSQRERKRDGTGKVRPTAYYRRQVDSDGISVGLTSEGAVAGLEYNFGYCRAGVGQIVAIGHNLAVHVDLSIPNHALIVNVPFMETEDDGERELARLIAGQLARISIAITCDSFPPAGNNPADQRQI